MLDESLEDNPKNEQPQSDPAVQAEEVPEALFAIQSVNSLNYNDEPKGNPVEEDLAMDDDLVVVHNHNRNEFNQAEIIRLYQEEIEKAEIEKKRIEQRRL